MTKGGRARLLDASAAQPGSRLGRRSLLCALVAFLLAVVGIGGFAATPADAPEIVKDVSTVSFMVLFLVAAPAIHIFGILLGLTALFRVGDSKGLALLGTLLNLILILAGAGLVYAGLQGMASFT